MTGNATYRYTNTAVLSVCAVDAPNVVTSADFDDRLADTYERVGMRSPGCSSTSPASASAAGGRTTSRSPTPPRWPAPRRSPSRASTPSQIGLLVNTSVSRAYLEPSTAVAVHHALGLPTGRQNFDLANACLGFVNGMQLAGAMIDAGQIEYALVVDGEGSARTVQENTIERLSRAERRPAQDVHGASSRR